MPYAEDKTIYLSFKMITVSDKVKIVINSCCGLAGRHGTLHMRLRSHHSLIFPLIALTTNVDSFMNKCEPGTTHRHLVLKVGFVFFLKSPEPNLMSSESLHFFKGISLVQHTG